MDEYRNIAKVNTQEDGSMNIVLRSGKLALVRIRELDRSFRAEVYRLFEGGGQGEDLLTRLSRHEGFQECAREALGWVDENTELVEAPAESGERVEP